MNFRQWMLCAMLSAGALSPVQARDAGDVVIFSTAVKVDVDAAGEAVGFESSAELSPALRDLVETRARELQFRPAMVDGQARGGVTYAMFTVCAVPEGDRMLVAAEFGGNGPVLADGAISPAPPRYPVEALKRGLSADLIVHYEVQADGGAVFESLEYAEGTRAQGRRLFEAMAQDWVAGMRYTPEQVGGEAVATRISMPVSFEVMRGGRREAQRMLERNRQEWLERPECQAAQQAQGGGHMVSAESPFVIRDAG